MTGALRRYSADSGSLLFDARLSGLATERDGSLFAQDISDHRGEIETAIRGQRILVTGGAGSIGSATIELLLGYDPAAVHVLDVAENGLVELVRDFRSRPAPVVRGELRLLPIDYGSAAAERFLQSESPYDLVLHFAAHKHVRSEKDVPSVIQMLDTNVVKAHRFLKWLVEYGHSKRCFAVSTDKAANPTSLMGASKRLMEHVLFSMSAKLRHITSTRFANVAFSNGSLLQGFLFRLARQQPIAVPRQVRRYFVSPKEAAEICLLSAAAAEHGYITFPRLDPDAHLRPLVDVAVALLESLGLEPKFYDDEAMACAAVSVDIRQGCYPVLLTPLDTSGEKPYEEFVAADEAPVRTEFSALSAVRYVPPSAPLDSALAFIDTIATSAKVPVEKADIVKHIAAVVPSLQHIETGRNLDDRT